MKETFEKGENLRVKQKIENTRVYPVILIQDGPGYVVKIPNLEITTEGSDLAGAIAMARDSIAMKLLVMEDKGLEIPEPYSKFSKGENDIETLVDVDMLEYRKKQKEGRESMGKLLVLCQATLLLTMISMFLQTREWIHIISVVLSAIALILYVIIYHEEKQEKAL